MANFLCLSLYVQRHATKDTALLPSCFVASCLVKIQLNFRITKTINLCKLKICFKCLGKAERWHIHNKSPKARTECLCRFDISAIPVLISFAWVSQIIQILWLTLTEYLNKIKKINAITINIKLTFPFLWILKCQLPVSSHPIYFNDIL